MQPKRFMVPTLLKINLLFFEDITIYLQIRCGRSILLPIKKITTVCQYHATADIRVDCDDHIYHTGKLNDELIAWRIEIDGKVETDPKVLQDITEEAIEKARTISQMVDQWDWKKKAMKYEKYFGTGKLLLINGVIDQMFHLIPSLTKSLKENRMNRD